TRKKIEIYLGINLKGYYGLVMCLSKKSRVLRKETEEIIVLHQKIQNYIDAMIPYCYILIDAPLCSKAKTMLNEHGWKVFHREIGSRE
ncbi:MAG: hypothetical protein LGB62_04585, partial [Sulfurovum sp.]|nr:hypothetical protein [Sulfurovum sp.]